MAEELTIAGLDREVLLDVSVNVVPIVIMGFFSLLFLVVAPWGWDGFHLVVSHGLLVVPIATLGALTYVAARAIGTDPHE